MKECLYKIVTGEKKGPHIEIIKIFLWLLSLIYVLGVKARLFLYKTGILPAAKLPKPVISVGNITIGGAGKTPLVMYLAKRLKEQGKKPVILIRGYMTDRGEESDEARMLEEELSVPVLVGPDRANSARQYLKDRTCDCFIMDDGFSHLKLKRDLDIVALDAADPWGQNFFLPRGFLRESPGALKRSGVIVLTRTDQVKEQGQALRTMLAAQYPDAVICSSVHRAQELVDLRSRQKYAPDFISRKKIAALSAIGSPAGFERTLVHWGAAIMRHFSFMDHHVYTQEDIKSIAQFCSDQKINMIVTTEKDRAKLENLLSVFPGDIQLLSLKINLTITDNEDALLKRIADLS